MKLKMKFQFDVSVITMTMKTLVAFELTPIEDITGERKRPLKGVRPKLKMHGKLKCKLAPDDSPYVIDVGGDIITVHLDMPPPHVGLGLAI